MTTLLLVLSAGGALLLAYFTYGRWLSARVFHLDPDATTPAHARRDDRDFVPTARSVVFGHHFTSIAGTGPIVGPAIAVMWGWLPAILWVVLGSIFVGAVHDLGAIVLSLRKKGRSIGDIAGDLLGPRARLIFLAILIVGLWIVLAIFGLVIASVLRKYPAAVFPVLFQTPLAIAIGFLIHRKGKAIALASVITLALMYASVIFGNRDFGPTIANLHAFNVWASQLPIWVWVVFLLAYSYVASVLPVWLLLQPRDYINALQLISSLGLIVAGLIAAAKFGGADPIASGDGAERLPLELVAPMVNCQPAGAPPLFPVLFITVACGACSGFHCLVGSGASSKQINRETDARAIGFGSMLTEGFLATLVIAACAAGLGLGATHALSYTMNGRTQAAGAAAVRAEGSMFSIPLSDGPSLHVITVRRGDPAGPLTAPLTNPCLSRVQAYSIEERAIGYYGVTVEDEAPKFVIGRPERDPQTIERSDGPEELVNPDLVLTDADVTQPARFDAGTFRVSPDGNLISLTGELAFAKQYESWAAAEGLGRTVGAFVDGSANFLRALGIPLSVAVALMAVMVASFAATTMDTACRLQRYVVQELAAVFLPTVKPGSCLGCGYDLRSARSESNGAVRCPECAREHSLAELALDPESHIGMTAAAARLASPLNPFKWLATTHGATMFAVVTAGLLAAIPAPGQAWSLEGAGRGALILWPLFGATNQLLAGFAFLVILAWLRVTKRPLWFALLPAALMLVVPAAAMFWQAYIGNADNPSWFTSGNWLLVGVATVALALEAWLLTEALMRWRHAPDLLKSVNASLR